MRKGRDKVRWINAESLYNEAAGTHRSPNVACSGNAGSTMNLAASAAAPGRAIPRPSMPGPRTQMTAGKLIPTHTRLNPARGVSPLVNRPSEARDLSARAVIRGGHSCNLPLASTRYVRVAKPASHRGSFTRTRPNVGLREEELNSAEEDDKEAGEGEGIDCEADFNKEDPQCGPICDLSNPDDPACKSPVPIRGGRDDPDKRPIWSSEGLGVNLPATMFSVALGLAVYFVVPCPADLTREAWRLLAIFCTTVAGLVVKPAPVGMWCFMSLTFTVMTKTLTFEQGLASLTNQVIWLIVVASFFARAFIKTGFGDRLGLLFVRAFGSDTLKLAYGLQTAEAVLSPAMPSTTARAAGVFVPIVNSLDDRTKTYLMSQQLQGGNVTSCLLVSAAAQNFLCMQIATGMGIPFTNPFMDWLVASSVPSILGILATPIVIYLIDPPGVKETPEAPIIAAKKLEELGPIRGNELKMVAGLSITVFMWIFGTKIGVSPALAAMIGFSLLMVMDVISWDEALEQKGAWDTLLWFSVLISMSGQLNTMGVVPHFANAVSSSLAAMDMGWMQVFALLHGVYFIMHYFFASQSAHVGALYPAFLSMMLASGTPPMLAALTLGFNTNLFGGLTHYASGQAACYFSSGHVPMSLLWKQGAYMSVVNLLIYSTVGMAWWKMLGLW